MTAIPERRNSRCLRRERIYLPRARLSCLPRPRIDVGPCSESSNNRRGGKRLLHARKHPPGKGAFELQLERVCLSGRRLLVHRPLESKTSDSRSRINSGGGRGLSLSPYGHVLLRVQATGVEEGCNDRARRSLVDVTAEQREERVVARGWLFPAG